MGAAGCGVDARSRWLIDVGTTDRIFSDGSERFERVFGALLFRHFDLRWLLDLRSFDHEERSIVTMNSQISKGIRMSELQRSKRSIAELLAKL
jgi:hypothetical protein